MQERTILEGVLKCWDLLNSDSYDLNISCRDDETEDTAISLAFCPSRNLLAVGTQAGKCIFWKESSVNHNAGDFKKSDRKWLNVFCCDLKENCRVSSIYFGTSVLVHSGGNMVSMKQSDGKTAYKDGKAAIQIDEGTIALFYDFQEKPFALLETSMRIRGLAIDFNHVCVWSDEIVRISTTEKNYCETLSEIPLQVECVAICNNSLYIAQNRSLLVTDLSGVQRLTIRFPEEQGCPRHLDIVSNLLVIYTAAVIKIMDISKKEPQLLNCYEKCRLVQNDFQLESVLSVKTNADGSTLSLLTFDRRLYFFNVKNGTLKSTEAFLGVNSVISHFWDHAEPKVFMCEIRSNETTFPRALTFFVSEDAEVLLHHDAELGSWSSVLTGLCVPHFSFLSRTQRGSMSILASDVFFYHTEELLGFENCSSQTPGFISALTDFSFYIASGDVDKAYICADPMKKNEVWERLAKACIGSERLDMAKLCFDRMGHRSGIMAVQKAEEGFGKPEIEVPLAEVAIQLGLMGDAERLYRKCNRLDLLCNLFRRRGLWEKAFETASADPLLTKSLHFYYGQHLEQKGEVAEAMSHFEKSSLPRRMVLQKMIDHSLPVDNYLKRVNDNELISMYASYVESLGDITLAKSFYSSAGDNLNLIRLAIAEGDVEYAFRQVKEHNCKAGAYQLGCHIEAEGDISGALECYSLSGMYNYAIRLSKKHGADDYLMKFAMLSQDPQAMDCAYYFLEKNEPERAARLFAKAGDKAKAIDIIMQLPLDDNTFHVHSEFASMIGELDIDISDGLVQKCAEFLLKSGKTEEALNLIRSKGYSFSSRLQFCRDNDIILDENLVSNILMEKRGVKLDKNEVKARSTAVADVCKRQGNYKLACKKYTQAGDRINAMKALLKSGDTKNIINFASASRSKEAYILAANYLSAL